jgi:bifunctional UDP-N-acetylglucosamine pyrophosphorylase/glucosamine-1-phosphate N-acetyltransferase
MNNRDIYKKRNAERYRNPNDIIVIIFANKNDDNILSSPIILNKVGTEIILIKLLNNVKKIKPTKIIVVTDHYHDDIYDVIYNHFTNIDIFEIIKQKQNLGTADAIITVKNILSRHLEAKVFIIDAIMPMLSVKIMKKMLDCDKIKLLLTHNNSDPNDKIIFDNEGKVLKIINYDDCDLHERKLKLSHLKCYTFHSETLLTYIFFINCLNNNREYRLSDIISIIQKKTIIEIDTYTLKPEQEIEGRIIRTIQDYKDIDNYAHAIELTKF